MLILTDLLAVCIEAGRLACERIRTIHATGDLKAIEKGDGNDEITGRPMRDIQTEADRQSEQIIFSTIRKFFPYMRIIGEEESSGFTGGDDEQTEVVGSKSFRLEHDSSLQGNVSRDISVRAADLVLFVDPLDGTGEFVSGRMHCVSVIIGIAHKGKPLAGVISRPFPDLNNPSTCLYGVVGVGAFLDHQRIGINRVPNTVYKIATTLKKSNRITDRFFELCQPCEVVREGGAGWKCWLVATGIVHCYQYARPGTKKWDILAGDAIVTALGGIVTDACGRCLPYSTDPATLNNAWGIIVSLDRKWHFEKAVAASHQALYEAANDPSFNQWPHGFEIPPLHKDCSS